MKYPTVQQYDIIYTIFKILFYYFEIILFFLYDHSRINLSYILQNYLHVSNKRCIVKKFVMIIYHKIHDFLLHER